MKKLSIRTIYCIAFIVVGLLLSVSFYLQNYKGMIPCPLCLLQRAALMLLGLLFFLGAVFKFKKCGHIILSLLVTLVTSIGTVLAGRQAWLQLFADNQKMDCSASLEYMLRALPIKQVIAKIFAGSTECSFVEWRFLSLSLADWSLLCFVSLLLLAIWQFCRALRF